MEFGLVDVLLTLGLAAALYYAFTLFAQGSSGSNVDSVKKPAALQKSSNSTSTSGAGAEDKPMITFLFGSQSGTAENYAYDLAEEGKQQGFACRVYDLEEYEVADLPSEKFAVFLVATFGEGEPTDNAQEFWKYITAKKEERDPDSVEGVVYSVFALGNRQYRHFCAVGRRIDTELEAMGGDRLMPIGLGDDDGTLEEDYDNWRQTFWTAARGRFLKSSGDDEKSDITKFSPMYEVTLHTKASGNDVVTKYQGGLTKVARFFNDPAKDHKTAILPIVESRELRTDVSDGGSTVHLELSLEDEAKMNYRTADNLGIHPQNDERLAARLAARLGVGMDSVFTISTRGNRRLNMPSPCSVEDLLINFADINSLVRGKFAAILSSYTDDAAEKAKLLSYATDAKDEFADLKYNWVELLEAFPGVKVPFAHLIEMVPRLQHRFYTISSSSKVQPRRIAVTVSRFVKDKPEGRKHIGVCSDQLCRTVLVEKKEEQEQKSATKLVVFVRGSSFRLPVRAGTPVIMIGPGTGIAPFRGFVQEFRTRTGDHKFGTTVLYFGCRNPEVDYLYKEELEKAVEDKVLDELHVAFSREKGKPKVYVQNLLSQNAASTWKLLNEGAHLYVCGGTLMGRDVLNTIVEICKTQGGLTPAAAEGFVERMLRTNRYVQELWSS